MTQTFAKLKLVTPKPMALKLGPAKLKLRAQLRFPGNVSASSPINISASYGISLDINALLAAISYPLWNSPALTGIPTAPTAAIGTNTTQIATTAFVLANGGGSSTLQVASISALQAVDTTKITLAYLTATGRSGMFIWTTGNFSAQIAADTTQGIYIKATAIAATAGAWVRSFDDENYYSQWFGTTTGGSSSANSALISTALTVMAQTSATMSSVMHIEPGILFSITGLTISGVSSQVHIEIDYLANNETSQGSQAAGQGTSERKRLIVSSGFPASTNSGVVIETGISGPLNPGWIIDVRKEMANTNAFFNDGVAVPSAKQNRLPTLNNSDAARASFIIRDEGVNRFGLVYTGYANSTLTSVGLGSYRNTRSLAGSAGFTSSTAWGGVAGNVPAAGDIITGQTSNFRGVVYGAVTGDIINTTWIQGRPTPGEYFKNERTGTVSSVALSGSAIGYGELTNSALFFAVNTPNISVDVEPGDLKTVFGVGGRFTVTKSRGLANQTMETVTNPAVVFSEGVGAPTAGMQLVYDTSVAAASRRLNVVRNVAQSTAFIGHVGSSTAHGAFYYSGGIGILGGGFNVASIVRNSIGNYTVTFATAMSSINYKVIFGSASYVDMPSYGSRAVSSFVILVHDYTGALRDPIEIAFEVKGGDI